MVLQTKDGELNLNLPRITAILGVMVAVSTLLVFAGAFGSMYFTAKFDERYPKKNEMFEADHRLELRADQNREAILKLQTDVSEVKMMAVEIRAILANGATNGNGGKKNGGIVP